MTALIRVYIVEVVHPGDNELLFVTGDAEEAATVADAYNMVALQEKCDGNTEGAIAMAVTRKATAFFNRTPMRTPVPA